MKTLKSWVAQTTGGKSVNNATQQHSAALWS